MTMKIALAALSLALSAPTALAHSEHADKLISIYADLNDICRGGSGAEVSTTDACNVRKKVHSRRDLPTAQ